MTPELTRAKEMLADADRVCVLTGAGVSAESGVPTFRGADGLWKQYRAEDLATPEAFERDPRLVWEWYGWRRDIVSRCEPNAAHRALAVAARERTGLRIVTQNVDGLHAAAAEAERAVPDAVPLELHGSLFRVRCTSCSARRVDRGSIDATSADTLPRCDQCGALLRPDIVWFGEALDRAILEQAAESAATADVSLVVGTSGLVQPAAGLADLTRRSGGRVIEVNLADTPLTPLATLTLRGPAAAVVPLIL